MPVLSVQGSIPRKPGVMQPLLDDDEEIRPHSYSINSLAENEDVLQGGRNIGRMFSDAYHPHAGALTGYACHVDPETGFHVYTHPQTHERVYIHPRTGAVIDHVDDAQGASRARGWSDGQSHGQRGYDHGDGASRGRGSTIGIRTMDPSEQSGNTSFSEIDQFPEDDWDLRVARTYVLDAAKGRVPNIRIQQLDTLPCGPPCVTPLAVYQVLHHRYWRWAFTMVVVALLSLAVFEWQSPYACAATEVVLLLLLLLESGLKAFSHDGPDAHVPVPTPTAGHAAASPHDIDVHQHHQQHQQQQQQRDAWRARAGVGAGAGVGGEGHAQGHMSDPGQCVEEEEKQVDGVSGKSGGSTGTGTGTGAGMNKNVGMCGFSDADVAFDAHSPTHTHTHGVHSHYAPIPHSSTSINVAHTHTHAHSPASLSPTASATASARAATVFSYSNVPYMTRLRHSASCPQLTWARVRVLLILLSLLDIVVWLCSQRYREEVIFFRLTRILRPFFLIEKGRVLRKLTLAVLFTVPSIIEVVLLIGLNITCFGVVGFLLFSERCLAIGPNSFFVDVETSVYSMLILMTTANFPDVMMDSYSKHNVTALFFIIYLLLALYLLFNIVLAAVYSKFQTQAQLILSEIPRIQTVALCAAFEILAHKDDGRVVWDSRGRVVHVHADAIVVGDQRGQGGLGGQSEKIDGTAMPTHPHASSSSSSSSTVSHSTGLLSPIAEDPAFGRVHECAAECVAQCMSRTPNVPAALPPLSGLPPLHLHAPHPLPVAHSNENINTHTDTNTNTSTHALTQVAAAGFSGSGVKRDGGDSDGGSDSGGVGGSVSGSGRVGTAWQPLPPPPAVPAPTLTHQDGQSAGMGAGAGTGAGAGAGLSATTTPRKVGARTSFKPGSALKTQTHAHPEKSLPDQKIPTVFSHAPPTGLLSPSYPSFAPSAASAAPATTPLHNYYSSVFEGPRGRVSSPYHAAPHATHAHMHAHAAHAGVAMSGDRTSTSTSTSTATPSFLSPPPHPPSSPFTSTSTSTSTAPLAALSLSTLSSLSSLPTSPFTSVALSSPPTSLLSPPPDDPALVEFKRRQWQRLAGATYNLENSEKRKNSGISNTSEATPAITGIGTAIPISGLASGNYLPDIMTSESDHSGKVTSEYSSSPESVKEYIPWSAFLRFMQFVRPDLENSHILVLFRAMDVSGTGNISVREWLRLCDLIDVSFKGNTDAVTRMQQHNTQLCARGGLAWVFYALRVVFLGPLWEALVDAGLLCYFVFLLAALDNRVALPAARSLGYVLMCFSLAETALKLLLCLPGHMRVYWRRRAHQWDACLAVTALGMLLFSSGDTCNRYFLYLAMFRALRLVRHLRLSMRFRAILVTVKRLYPALRSLFLIMFGVYYFFGVLGVDLFRNLIIPGQMDEEFMKTYYANNNYWENNFDDLFHAFVTLFEIMIINNWNLTVEGFTAASHSNWPRVYFCCFFFCTVVVMMNVVVALVLEAFIGKYSVRDGGEGKDELDMEEKSKELLTAALLQYVAERGERDTGDQREDDPSRGELRMRGGARVEKDGVLMKTFSDTSSRADKEDHDSAQQQQLVRIVLKKRTQRLYRMIFDTSNVDV